MSAISETFCNSALEANIDKYRSIPFTCMCSQGSYNPDDNSIAENNIIQIITVAGKGLWRDKQYAHKYILFFWIFVLRYSFQYVVYVVREVFCSSRSTIFLILGFLKIG